MTLSLIIYFAIWVIALTATLVGGLFTNSVGLRWLLCGLGLALIVIFVPVGRLLASTY